MRFNYDENSDNRNSLSPKSQLFSIQNITGQSNLTELSNKQSNSVGNNNVAVAAAALIKNLETNKMFASYLNQLKFPFNMSSYSTGNIDLKSQISSSSSALTSASSPTSSACASPVSNAQTSPLLDLSVKKQRNEKLNDTTNVNNVKKMNFFGSVHNILPSVSTSSLESLSNNKDALDLTLPNRSRLNESTSQQINNEIQPLILKSNSSSSTSSISPLSSVSNSSSSPDINNRPTISSLMLNSSKSKPDELKKSKNLKRKKLSLNDDEIKCKKESNDTPLALLNRPQQPQNIESSFQQQQNILNSILLNAAANQNSTISQPILNSFPNGFLFPNLQPQQHQPLNPALFQQYNNNPFIFMNQKQQNETDKNSMNKMLDQLMQYSNYMKLVESYQKNISQTNSLTNLMGGLGSGFSFNPALLSNNYLSINGNINSSTSNNNNTTNSNSMDPTSQPLALSLTNSGL